MPSITTLSEPMAVTSSAPYTTCVVCCAAGMASVWLGKIIPPGPSVMVWSLTTTVVGLGPMVKEVLSMTTLDPTMSTGRPPIVVLVGVGDDAAAPPPPLGGLVIVAPTPSTSVGLMVKVLPSTTTIDVGCAGLSINVWLLMTTALGFTMTVMGGDAVISGGTVISAVFTAVLTS